MSPSAVEAWLPELSIWRAGFEADPVMVSYDVDPAGDGVDLDPAVDGFRRCTYVQVVTEADASDADDG